jgi:hypothetical protein
MLATYLRFTGKAASRPLAVWALALALASAGSAFAGPGADLSNLVVAGDSLSAGYQNSQLLENGQLAGYANLLAIHAGLPQGLNPPLVLSPGFPQVDLVPIPPVGIRVAKVVGVDPAVGWLTGPTRDYAVPGFTLQAFVGLPTACAGDLQLSPLFPIQFMQTQILNPNCDPATTGKTQLQLAAGRKPSTTILWIGSNDALFPILFGMDLTKPADFAAMYLLAASTMARSSKTLVVATIPDVTLLPYLTSITDLAAGLKLPPIVVAAALGLQPGDKVTPLAFQLLQGGLTTLPEAIPDPTSPTGYVPVVIRAKKLMAIRQAVLTYNATIYLSAWLTGATVVDIYSLVNNISAQGVLVDGVKLTTAFGGGLFSCDGVHPTNTGYAVIAREFAQTLNRRLRTNIAPIVIEAAASTDPFLTPEKSCLIPVAAN